ncbi:MAG: rod shape-determining protein RodA [Acidimicrobiaceae bacterium]|jgi:rod shape determining protein RodA|nr:rod shape-determining protein RodA [Acidimicrobiaceae bacterium]
MTTFPAAGRRFREERDPWWFVVDPLLILSVMAITAMGALLVYSATRGPATELDPADTSFLTRQVFFAVVGASFGLFAALVNIERIRSLVSVAYIGTLGLLFGTLLFGADVNGTQAWYRVGSFTFQPSEPGKLVLIVTLATVFSSDRVGFQRMAAGLLLAGVPIGLILLQPDLGTVLVYIVVTAVMIMMSNISMRLILLLVLAAITAITAIFTSDVLEDYQKDRLTVFVLDDEAVAELGADAVRVAYNAEQSQIAIGNGGLTGTGLFQGTQTSSNLVPEQQTDFIFSVAGEELGFRGAAILLMLFTVVVLRIWRVAVRASEEFDRLMAVGVMSMFVFQVFQSAGMTMGMMPVTGIPMPFVSYGGSSMLTSMIAIGLILGVYRRRFDYVRA